MKKYVSNESKRTGDKTGDPSRLESGNIAQILLICLNLLNSKLSKLSKKEAFHSERCRGWGRPCRQKLNGEIHVVGALGGA